VVKVRTGPIFLRAVATAFLITAFGAPARSEMSGGVVRIGVLGDYGSGRDLGGPGSVTAAKLAAEDFKNQVNGKPIEIVSADHQNKPDIASAIARKWFEVDGVDAITDLAVSSVGLAVAKLAAQSQRTVLISGAATSDLTGPACAPVITHWADDTYVLAAGLAAELTRRVGKKWYFMTVDYAFGHSMFRDGKAAVEAAGGQVVGRVSFPFNPQDFASFLLPAQASGANILAIASTGHDTVAAVRQAHEFGLQASGMTIVCILTLIADVHSLGLEAAQGMYAASEYYWDEDDASRAFANRFFAIENRMPTKLQAATYAAVHHYLRAIQTIDSDDALKVNAEMRKLPVDFFGRPAHIRRDGRVIYDLALYQVKTPQDSKRPWDYYKKVAELPGETSFRREDEGGCPLNATAAPPSGNGDISRQK
jgi:branched-chain amino acid transport system substrate-binding protein